MGKEKWIFYYIRKNLRLFTLSILLGSLSILLGGALMFSSGYLISKAATLPESILLVYVPIVGVRTFGLSRAVCSYVERLAGHSLVLKILSEMRVKLFTIIEPQSLTVRSRFKTGEILSLLADDIEHLQDFYLKTIFPAIISILIYTVIIICTGLFSLPFAIMLAFLMGLLVFVSPFLSLLYNKKMNVQLKQIRNLLYFQLTDAIFGLGDWKFAGYERNFLLKAEKQERYLLEVEAKKRSFINYRDLIGHAVLGSIVVLVILWSNGLTIEGEIPPTLIAAFGLVSLSLLESFIPLAGVVSESSTYQDSLNRLVQVEKKIPTNPHIAKDLHDVDTSRAFIEINELTFQYLPNQPTLNHINLKVEQGGKIAVLGRSGSGKTTLLNLIMGGIMPTAGNVLINGKHAYEWGDSIHRLVGILNQKPYLFNTTILNNIRLGNPAASDEEVVKAAQMVQLDEMINKLPKGYETNMLEAGSRFSGGEKQRIALARILLQNTPIVLLDEPTVGMDSVTEVNLLTSIFHILKGKTIIWVTHHLTGVEHMDQILFLEGGEVVMQGTHQQLLKSKERYRRLYSLDCPFSSIKSKQRTNC
jgi:ATP-binding cassette, subfamily C, bacterial CydC